MRLTSKLKEARKYLKDWQRNIPRLSATIDNIKLVIQFLDMIEECRDMGIQEWNFRDTLQTHLSTLQQKGSIK
jgi:thymidylate synthase